MLKEKIMVPKRYLVPNADITNKLALTNLSDRVTKGEYGNLGTVYTFTVATDNLNDFRSILRDHLIPVVSATQAKQIRSASRLARQK